MKTRKEMYFLLISLFLILLSSFVNADVVPFDQCIE
ncbi:hypothetical protein LCGC14_2192440, partial [marine sediment metagenome]